MISSIAWIRRGVAKEIPEKYEMDEAEYARIVEFAKDEIEVAKEAMQMAQMSLADSTVEIKADEEIEAKVPDTTSKDADIIAAYNLEDYDETGDDYTIFNAADGLAEFKDNNEDPYITLKDNEDDEDNQDICVSTGDNMVLVGKTEDELSHLEIYVYDREEEHLYVHHDIMLPSFPLCVEPINFDFGKGVDSNFCAVGTFQPEIEIWNIDLIDAMYPRTILGIDDSEKKKSKKKKNKAPSKLLAKLPSRHTDAVLDLSWNSRARNMLASASADTTVKLWDLSTQQCQMSYEHHTDKVAVVKFNPNEPTVMVTGSYDKTVAAFDARSPKVINTWSLTSDVECIRWDPHNSSAFIVSTENGIVQYFDARAGQSKPLFTLAAHSYAVSALDLNTFIPGMMLTGSADKTLKIWDISSGRPSMVASRDFGNGKVFAASFCVDSPYHVAIGGSKGNMIIWNVTENSGIRKSFEGRSSTNGVVTMSGPGAIDESAVDAKENKHNAAAAEKDELQDSGDEFDEVLEEMSGNVDMEE